ncbi:hypothetical protein IH879_08550 [candidate division KSB1 bacterium]|nr:hypothetical protein [candidate division KSB1 bacterium]
MIKSYLNIFLMILCSVLCSCQKASHVSTAEDRAALFDTILAKTMEREAFSPIKNEILNLHIKAGMLRFKDEMIAANTDEKLFNVLMKISNARKDRHLSVGLVDGGLELPGMIISHAPIRFAADYGTPEAYFFFVSDYAKNILEYTGENQPEIGDKLTAVNGQPIAEYFDVKEPYHRYSTTNGLWWKFAEALPQQTYRIPSTLKENTLECTLEKKDGVQYTIELPYFDPENIDWQGFYQGFGDERYPGFSKVYSCQTYVLHKHDHGQKVLVLDWYGFRENLVADMDRLVEYAAEHNMLDYAIIWDGTRSRGGSKGAYALQRLSPKPFKTTFGNVRISDITGEFIRDRQKRFVRKNVTDHGVTETINDGSWLMDWLESDVTQAIKDGQAYSNNVPFKLAHLPKHSDGILQPAEIHFTGKLVCFFSPYGGSHLDQFAAQVVDNGMAYTIGMPAGGYSNTWEWEETLVFPTSKKPVVQFMWSMGHTIRPNGEILEGNPAQMNDYIPVTRHNYLTYTEILLESAFKHLGMK